MVDNYFNSCMNVFTQQQYKSILILFNICITGSQPDSTDTNIIMVIYGVF